MTKKKQAAKRASRRPLQLSSDQAQAEDWRRELKYGSDRSICIIAVANLEAWLADLICTKFAYSDVDTLDRLYRPEGPLSTFSCKIELAYAMGLISDEDRLELNKIKNIRNDFAHNTSIITFETQAIKELCLTLKFGGTPAKGITPAMIDKMKDHSSSRFYFIHTVTHFQIELIKAIGKEQGKTLRSLKRKQANRTAAAEKENPRA
ncbi:MAG: hypothetical protein WAN43_03675 [Rhodomicrobium sp.]